MPLTPQEVAGKVFGPTRMRRGYDENEVDAFLDQVETELTRLTTENDRLKKELEQARRQLAGQGGSATAAMTTVTTAPRPASEPEPTAAVERAESPQPAPAAASPAAPAAAAPVAVPDDQAVEHRVARMLVLAQQTADAALREAQVEADRTRGEARVEAERMVSEARARTAEEIGRLQRNKSTLESEVEQLQTFEREYRQRLRAYLEMQLRELDHDPGPAAVEGGPSTSLGQGGAAGSQPGADHGDAFAKSTTSPGAQGASHPGSAGLSEPPAFGQVWTPGDHGETAPGHPPAG
jgi:DivIVA domain-containing protein